MSRRQSHGAKQTICSAVHGIEQMISTTTMQAVEQFKAQQGDYLLEAEGIRKEFPGVVALTMCSSACARARSTR